MPNLKQYLGAYLLGFALQGSCAEIVDINTADANTLATAIVGIGPAKAEAIVAYRNEHGPFKAIDDLALVKGIGSATIAKNREVLSISTKAKE